MKKRILIIILIIIHNLIIFSNTNTDEDFLNMDIDEITKNDNTDDNIMKSKISKKEIEKYILLELTAVNRHVFNYSFINDSTINKNNRFDINTYYYTLYVDLTASLDLSSYFKIYVDNSFRFVHEGNELYNFIDEDHEDAYNNYLDNLVRELYLIVNIPIMFPIKIKAGRAFISKENSYLFNIFNDLAYEKKKISGLFDYDEVGVNMIDLSVYFPIVNLSIIYSPGFPGSNETTEYLNIQEEQCFFGVINFRVPYVNFGFNGFIDTSLKWSIGSSVAVNASDSLIIYSDFKIKGNEKIKRLIKKDDILYEDMHEYEWEETERYGFEGVIFGINFTPGTYFNIILEIYFNSSGMTPPEQKEYYDYLCDINNYHENPQSISIPDGVPSFIEKELKKTKKEQEEGYADYYYGVLGDSMTEYNVFDLGMLFLFFQVSKDDIASTGLDLYIGFFIYLLDGSTMLIPKIRYNFLKYFVFEINANIYLGYKGSLFGEMPHMADIQFLLEIKI